MKQRHKISEHSFEVQFVDQNLKNLENSIIGRSKQSPEKRNRQGSFILSDSISKRNRLPFWGNQKILNSEEVNDFQNRKDRKSEDRRNKICKVDHKLPKESAIFGGYKEEKNMDNPNYDRDYKNDNQNNEHGLEYRKSHQSFQKSDNLREEYNDSIHDSEISQKRDQYKKTNTNFGSWEGNFQRIKENWQRSSVNNKKPKICLKDEILKSQMEAGKKKRSNRHSGYEHVRSRLKLKMQQFKREKWKNEYQQQKTRELLEQNTLEQVKGRKRAVKHEDTNHPQSYQDLKVDFPNLIDSASSVNI